MHTLKKKGQINILLWSIVSLIVLAVIFLSFHSFNQLSQQKETTELINLEKSIQTKILQQSVRPESTFLNVSFAVPTGVEKICFFDSEQKFDRLRNLEVVNLFRDDKIHNLFLFTKDGTFPYAINNLLLDKNPLCAKIVNNKITIQMISKQQKTLIDVQEDKDDASCISVLENGDPDTKIDIAFVPYGFSKLNDYNNEINRFVNRIFLQFEPFKSNTDKFNFYRVDDSHIECEIGDFIQCDNYQIREAASNCPHDYIVLLVDRSKIEDFVLPVRSSTLGNLIKLNTADEPFVLVHEFGHAFGDLADEYVDENYYNQQNFHVEEYPNCDSTPCSKWTYLSDTSCWSGCSLGRYFRPTKDSVMRSLSSGTYGPVNEQELKKRLLYYD